MNRLVMTVNSEMYERKGVGFELSQVRVVRPSLIVAVNHGKHKSPDRVWAEKLTSSLYKKSKILRSIFDVDRVLFPSFPVAWGGTRVSKIRKRSPRFFAEACYLKAVRQNVVGGFSDWKTVAPGVESNGQATRVYLGGEFPDYSRCGMVGGYMPKSEVSRIAKQQYGVRKVAYWTSPNPFSSSRAQVLDEAQSILLNLTEEKKERIYNEYMETFNHEEKGYMYVRRIVDDGQKVIHPKWTGFISYPVKKTEAKLDGELDTYSRECEENELLEKDVEIEGLCGES